MSLGLRTLPLTCGLLLFVTAGGAGQPSQEYRVRTLEAAAAKGSLTAQYTLGSIAEAERRYSEAVSWYQRAANRDYEAAQFKLGELLETGRGIEANQTQAFDWYRKASALGSLSAVARLKAGASWVPPPATETRVGPASSKPVEAPRPLPAAIDVRRGRIAVYVGPQTRDGFVDVDTGILGSIKDLKAELRNQRRLQIVESIDRAQVVLEVISRGATSTSGGGSVALPIDASTFFIPVGTIGLATVLRVGSHEKPIVFQNCQSWRRCARLVVKDVEVWLEANAAVIAPN